jgi:hypothetical protein
MLQEVEMNSVFKPKVPKEQDQLHILIATCFQDRDFARKLAAALRRDRVTPSIEIAEMSASDSLARKLASTTHPIDCVIPLISIISVAHNWVGRELSEVMSREINHRWVRTYPAKVDNCSLPAVLLNRFFADFYSLGWNEAYEAVKAAIQRKPGADQPTMRQPAARAPKPAIRKEELAPAPQPTDSKQVYLSYDHENDGYYRDVLLTWSKMPGFAQLWVNEQPPTVPVDGPEAEPVKQELSRRISSGSGLLCVVGANCCTNGWMAWEIKKADELGKRIIAVRINRDCAVPELLSEMGATCAMSFTFEGIRRAIEEAYGESSLD